MHTDSSASLTYLASRSASECTTTVLMPISRQARWMRSATSPRLAIRIFSNTNQASAEDEERLAVLHRLGVLDQHGLDHAVLVGLDLVQELHRLDDAQRIARLHRLADLDEGLGTGRGGAVERADHGRADDVALGRRHRGFALGRGLRGRR